MNKKIYFAGSIRGGREDAALYQRIIQYINRTDVVLTEHIGKSNLSIKVRQENSIRKFMSKIPNGSEVVTSL